MSSGVFSKLVCLTGFQIKPCVRRSMALKVQVFVSLWYLCVFLTFSMMSFGLFFRIGFRRYRGSILIQPLKAVGGPKVANISSESDAFIDNEKTVFRGDIRNVNFGETMPRRGVMGGKPPAQGLKCSEGRSKIRKKVGEERKLGGNESR